MSLYLVEGEVQNLETEELEDELNRLATKDR